MTRRVPVQFWVGLFVLSVVLVFGCAAPKHGHGEKSGQPMACSVTNLVFLSGTNVYVEELTNGIPNGTKTNKVSRGEKICWISTNTPPLEFFIIFSPTDDPEEDHTWKFKHHDHKEGTSIEIKTNHSVGIANKSFKYTVIVFADLQNTGSPSQVKPKPDEPQSSVITAIQDPFIIIKNW